jgi:hypothetical protein
VSSVIRRIVTKAGYPDNPVKGAGADGRGNDLIGAIRRFLGGYLGLDF